MSRTEGNVVMDQVLDAYLQDSQYEEVRKFNHEPQTFDFEKHTQDSIQRFRSKQEAYKRQEKEDEQNKGKTLGPQKHSKTGMPQIPGSMEHFILDEINKKIKK